MYPWNVEHNAWLCQAKFGVKEANKNSFIYFEEVKTKEMQFKDNPWVTNQITQDCNIQLNQQVCKVLAHRCGLMLQNKSITMKNL